VVHLSQRFSNLGAKLPKKRKQLLKSTTDISVRATDFQFIGNGRR